MMKLLALILQPEGWNLKLSILLLGFSVFVFGCATNLPADKKAELVQPSTQTQKFQYQSELASIDAQLMSINSQISTAEMQAASQFQMSDDPGAFGTTFGTKAAFEAEAASLRGRKASLEAQRQHFLFLSTQ